MATPATPAIPATPPKAAAAATPAPAPARKRKLALVIIIGGLLFAAAGGGAAWYFFANKTDASPVAKTEAKKEQPKKEPLFLALEIFTVNLADRDVDRYAQIGVTLALADSHADTVVKAYMPIIRNAVLLLLAGKHASDITSAEDKAKLANAIAEVARVPLPLPAPMKGIEGVYFSTFIIQ